MTILNPDVPPALSIQMRLFDASARVVTGGEFRATLTASAEGPGALIVTAPIRGMFDSSGRLASVYGGGLDLAASDLLVPASTAYEFRIAAPGVLDVRFVAPIKSGQTATDVNLTVAADLVTLSLNNFLASPAMLGAAVTGTAFQAGTVVSAIDTVANTVTLSLPALAAGAVAQATFTNAVDFRTLALGYLP